MSRWMRYSVQERPLDKTNRSTILCVDTALEQPESLDPVPPCCRARAMCCLSIVIVSPSYEQSNQIMTTEHVTQSPCRPCAQVLLHGQRCVSGTRLGRLRRVAAAKGASPRAVPRS